MAFENNASASISASSTRNYINYSDDAKSILQNVIKKCKEEKVSGEVQVPLGKPMERAATYTGVSERTLYRMQKSGTSKRRKTRTDKVTIDDFDRGVVRRTVYEFLVHRKRLPTLKSLNDALREKIGYAGGKENLRKTLHELGFRWRKTTNNRKLLMERNDIVLARINFLKKIKRFREDGRTIVYTDETFVHTNHTFHRSWQSDDIGLRVPFSKGQRMIVVHAGTESGFIHGADLVFKSQSHTGDYHDELTSANFMKWLSDKLLPNLPPRCVLIVDNAPYHNIQTDKCPTTATRKADIQGWLRRHNIHFDEKMLKAELLQLCKRNKPLPEYILDKTLREHGHECLRLPAYHADLNAIELVWAQLKGTIGRRNVTFKNSDMEQNIKDAMSSVSAEDWRSCCAHVQKVEEAYRKTDIAVADDVEDLVIQVCSSDEDTDTASEGYYSSDTDTADEM